MSDTNVAKSGAKGEVSERTESAVMLPPVDVIEDTLGITLYADLPGVPRAKSRASMSL
jgi:HSP20 family molecular chaperone IbpA